MTTHVSPLTVPGFAENDETRSSLPERVAKTPAKNTGMREVTLILHQGLHPYLSKSVNPIWTEKTITLDVRAYRTWKHVFSN
jgi:hypothetical protein